ncbi:TetR family transcriptional regulator [Streptomyces sp. MP131-18]|uniref:TetR family transcriptional regulator n=1 Tax=Streptomyces sp. MP131-18 TaxID=1857892 RepID=UPI00097C66B1|nr:TetR family transcriptional regulator [Streptomyces sp. MP131-18]ONK11252.1 transcriptional repressor BetI [Streptomyces sp. MP131-18]
MAPVEVITAQRRPAGRRPGNSTTRETVLAAESAFARDGYEKASIRAIAKAAKADAAVVRHFFTSKEGLSAGVMEDAIQPVDLVAAVTAGDGSMGEELPRAFLPLWEGEPPPARRWACRAPP